MDFLRLSSSARSTLERAAERSEELGHRFLGVEHVFLALGEPPQAPLARALAGSGLELERFQARLLETIVSAPHQPWGTEILFTPRCRELMQIASKVAARDQSAEVHDKHLLEALFREGRSVPLRLLQAMGVHPADVYDAVKPEISRPVPSATPLLDQYGRDLTAQARLGRLAPLIGRSAELDLLAQVLLRRNKNNPVLVGEAGVGKTAVVEGLAQVLVSEDCPAPLRESRIVELSTAALVAGTKYRGEFEDRLLKVVGEATGDPGTILFLDEIHTLVGAGAAGGEALDASNILKPALARGELRCIGATTIAEYRRFIERDAALERRFEPVRVVEPTPAEARQIVRGLRQALESHHGTRIDPAALDAAVELTVRYVPQRQLPDKAIDALDQSCARVRLRRHAERGAQAAAVSVDDVRCTVSQWTGIPLERVSGAQARRLLELEDELGRAVVGQEEAIRAVSRAVRTAQAGLAAPGRPSGVFLFLGPTGVGKTELAKALARALFGDAKRVVRFDMSEYSEAHSVAKLIGAPPGYVGHEEEGLLVAAVRTSPHCVVLFDELEKAHPQVFDVFLQIFDDGRLRGARGATADFTNAVIIMTSNLVLRAAPPPPVVGFQTERAEPLPSIDPRAALLAVLRPELVNRIDEVVVFRPLGPAELRRIVDRYVREIETLAAARSLRLELEDRVYDFLIERASPELYGARELRRVVDRQLRQPLAEALLRHGEGPLALRVAVEEGRLGFAPL